MQKRRIVRTSDDSNKEIIIHKKIYISVWQICLKISKLLLCMITIFWYWFQRVFLLFLVVGFAWWSSQKPSLYRDWENIDTILPTISWSWNIANIANIRDHEWKTDTEFVSKYFTGSYNLDEIEKMYYIITPFSDHDGPAHTMFSFTFSWGKNIAISAEIRKEKWESFSAFNWLMNQYEIQYVIATESDIIKLRTNYRENTVYMYPIAVPKEKIAGIFRSMLIRADKLTHEPEFYNTFWNNCTTSVLDHANAFRMDKLEAGKYVVLPSHSDEIIYHAGLIDTKLSPLEARHYYRIDELARSATGNVDFSAIIRKPIQ